MASFFDLYSYATFGFMIKEGAIIPCEIGIFRSEIERDEWVACEDEWSINDPLAADDERVALSVDEVRDIICPLFVDGKRLMSDKDMMFLIEDEAQPDLMIDNVKWLMV